MKLFGPKDKLSDLANLIVKEDVETLEKEFSRGWNIDEPVVLVNHAEPAIIIALSENKLKVVEWLILKSANLNLKLNPSIVIAASNCSPETLEFLIKNGADVNAKDRVGKTALNSILYDKRFENIPVLISNGYNIANDGVSLRQAVFSNDLKAIKILLELGFDVNLHKPNMVFPNNPTPVAVAAENNDFKTVKLLVKHGADVRIKDDNGFRAFDYAVENKNEEMIEFIKSLEPERWHNEELRANELKKYKLPPGLLNILRSDNRKLEINNNSHVKYIVFKHLLDVKEVKFKKGKLLDLLSEVDNYLSDGFLVWYPRNKCLSNFDLEHDVFKELGSWEEFIENPSKQIDKIFD
ncbi:MAG: ankyrin repeat domain-containing protein [Bacteroidota bacterium]